MPIKRLINIINYNLHDLSTIFVPQPTIQEQPHTSGDGNEYSWQSESQPKTEESLDQALEREYYGNLELPMGANFAAIKKNYRALVSKYHPDRHIKSESSRLHAEELTAKLNCAYQFFCQKFKHRDPG